MAGGPIEVFEMGFVCFITGFGAGFWTNFSAGGGGGGGGGASVNCLLFRGVVLTLPDFVNLTTPY